MTPPTSGRVDPSIWVAIIGVIPSALAILALLVVLLAFRKEIRRMLPGVRSVGAFGVSVALGENAVAQWTADANKRRALGVTSGDLKAALDRAQSSRSAYAGISVLWVDDHPEYNVWERRALRSLGALVTVALSNDEARDRMRRDEFELVISDLGRDNNEDAQALWRSSAMGADSLPVIYYVGDLKPGKPSEAFGITNRPDALINLVTDALQRRQFAQGTSE